MTPDQYAQAWLHNSDFGPFIQQLLWWCIGAAYGCRMFLIWFRVAS